MTAKGTYFPRRVNDRVPNMQYAADVRFGGLGTITIPAPLAASATAILSAQSIAVAGIQYTLATTFDQNNVATMGKFGRNVVVVGSGAATSIVRIVGKDYLGQPMKEALTLNGTTPVVGKKAFKWIDAVDYDATAAVTINVGTGNILGLPYKSLKLMSEMVDKVVPTAGTFVAAPAVGTTASLTSADPRGTYTPQASFVPNGSRVYELNFMHDVDQLHGEAHFFA